MEVWRFVVAVCKEVGRPFAGRVLQSSGIWKFNILNIEYRISNIDFRSEEARLETLAYLGMEDKKKVQSTGNIYSKIKRG